MILEGARQVGKTWLLKEFGEQEFDSVVYIDFLNPEYSGVKDLFAETISPDRIISYLESYFAMDITPGKTLIVFDEVQEAPEALASLKYFYEGAFEHAIIVAGSLLGIFLHKKISFPVGKVEYLRLEPMDFEEFLWATDNARIANSIRENPKEKLFNDKLYDLFKQYLITGGMPEVVKAWITEHSIEEVAHLQENLLSVYRGDFSKHTDETLAMRILQVFNTLPSQFAKSNSKYLYGMVREGARARDYELAIEWLISAGLLRRVNQVKRGDKIPLKVYAESNAFKLFFLDVGLFRALAGIPPKTILDKSAIFNEYNGLLAEQYVLQQLSPHQLYYWSSGATSEVDFVGQFEENIIPIEVKSGENVKAKSLRVYRDKYNPKLSVRFSLQDLQETDGLLNIPLYLSFIFDELIDQILN